MKPKKVRGEVYASLPPLFLVSISVVTFIFLPSHFGDLAKK